MTLLSKVNNKMNPIVLFEDAYVTSFFFTINFQVGGKPSVFHLPISIFILVNKCSLVF